MTDTTTAADTDAEATLAAATPDAATAEATATAPTTAAAAGPTPAAAPVTDSTTDLQTRSNRRRIREGKVISVAMEKTAVVETTSRVRHSRYKKIITRKGRLYVHDPHNDLALGDTVKVQETRPLSKQKRWRILEILERAR